MNVETSYSEPQFFNLTSSKYYSEQASSKSLGLFSRDDWDAVPVTAKPVPMPTPDGYSYSAMFDPNLSITPEKMRLPTLVKLNSAEGDDNDSFANFREMKVHFDQNVAVHHFSPEISTDLSTLVNSSLESNGSASPEMLTASPESDAAPSRFSSYNPADVSPKDVNLSGSSDEFTSSYSSSLGDAYASRCYDGELSTITRDLNALRAKDPELDLSIANSVESCEPISVVASDLCTNTKHSKDSFKKSLDSRFYSGRKPQSMPNIKVDKNVPEKELSAYKELPVVAGKSMTADGIRCLPKDQPVGMLLSQPELNSTLRLTKEMSSLKAKEFDVHAVLKDPKIKGRIDEKASVKLNADSALYTNLLSLEVREEELLSRVAEAQLAKARPETGTRIKPENLVSKPPDILEYFGSELQPEFASYTLFGIAPDRIETRTVDLDRAFDIYKRTRVWDRYDVNL